MDPEIQWRVEAMQGQLVPGQPVPVLVAGPGLQTGPGECFSCGEPLPEPEPPKEGELPPVPRSRCDLCVEAARLVLMKDAE